MSNNFVLTLKPGELITISGRKEPEGFQESMFGTRWHNKEPFQGKPWKVLATSFPFILVTDGDTEDTIDTQVYTVIRVNKEYARAYEKAHNLRNGEHRNVRPGKLITKRKKTKRKKHISECPMCDEKMAQIRKPDGVWAYQCKNCGFRGPDVPPEIIGK